MRKDSAANVGSPDDERGDDDRREDAIDYDAPAIEERRPLRALLGISQ